MHPVDTHDARGVVSKRSPFPVEETVSTLRRAAEERGLTIFALVDHSGAAARAGLTLRDTKLLIFGSPAAGTPVMAAEPLAALDLPLKVLVWEEDGSGAVWVSTDGPAYLAERHSIPPALAPPLAGAVRLMEAVLGPGGSSAGNTGRTERPA